MRYAMRFAGLSEADFPCTTIGKMTFVRSALAALQNRLNLLELNALHEMLAPNPGSVVSTSGD